MALSTDGLGEFLRDFCTFDRDSAYILTAMARPKENEQITHGNLPAFREILTSEERIDEKIAKLTTLGEHYTPEEGGELDFRLYITANSRDTRKAFFRHQKELISMSEQMSNGHKETHNRIKTLNKEWISDLQSDSSKKTNLFIIDIDEKNDKLLDEATSELESLTNIEFILETPNGYHIITDPFNYNEFTTNEGEDIEIKTDSLMFLTMI